jgi:hypothetical protein
VTKREFLICAAVLEAGAGKPIGQDQADVWFEMFQDIPADVFRDAVKRCLLESEYPGLPAIGKVRRYCSERMVGIPETPETVFELVRKAVSRFGYCDPLGAAAELGPAVWSVVQGIGGWERVCDNPVDQRATLFAQFRDAWKAAAERAATQAKLPEELRPAIADSRAQATVKAVAARLAIAADIRDGKAAS